MTSQLESIPRNDTAPAHILIMEDDLSVSKGLEMVLAENGFKVNLAGTGATAREAFNRQRFDLLVADLRLPDIDGMEVIREVRTHTPETEVIVITGYGTAVTAVEAMKLGVSDFLPKPFSDDQIKTAIANALQAREQRIPVQTSLKEPQTREERIIQKREVIQVMNRTWEDPVFWTDLMEKGSDALIEYRLSDEAKAAILSGDLKWINENVGELTQKQLMFIYKRLEREAW